MARDRRLSDPVAGNRGHDDARVYRPHQEVLMSVPVLTHVGETERGYQVYVKDNEVGGKQYWSDEIGGGVCIWDTSLVASESLRLALDVEEQKFTSFFPFLIGGVCGTITTSLVVWAYRLI